MFRVLVIILVLPIVLIALTQVYFVQNFIKDTAVHYLQKKLGTPVSIGKFRMSGFSGLVLEGVSVEDRAHRTLFYSGSLRVHYDLLPLLRGHLVVYNLQWDSVRADVYRSPTDSSFNYQFIIDAFSGSPDTSAEDTSGSSFSYEVDSVQLRSFALRFQDSLEGMLAVVRFDSIGLRPSEIQPDSMRFFLHDLYVNRLETDIRMGGSRDTTTGEDTASEASSLPWMAAGKITVLHSTVLFEDTAAGFGTTDTIGTLALSGLNLNLSKQTIATDSLLLAQTYSAIRLAPSTDTVTPAAQSDTSTGGYVIRGGALRLAGTTFRLDNSGTPASSYKDAIDFNHLDVDSLNAGLTDVLFAVDTLTGTVDHIALREKSGFRLRKLHAQVRYDPFGLSLDNLALITDHSHLGDTLEIRVPSWSSLSAHPEALGLHINLDSSLLDGADARFFAPYMADNPSMKPLLRKRIFLDAALRGSLDTLDIPRLFLSDQDGNLIRLRGRVLHGMSPDNLLADLQIGKIQTGDKPLRTWLAPGEIPSGISLPANLVVSGPFLGSKRKVNTDLHMVSTEGNLDLNAHLENYLDSLKAKYDVAFDARDLAAGHLLGDTTLGNVTASGMVRGSGWAFPHMEDTASIRVASLGYNRYVYHDMELEGALAPSAFSVYAVSRDTSVDFNLSFNGRLDSADGDINGRLTASRLDLYRTHWTAEPLTASVHMQAALPRISPYHLNGTVAIDSVDITTDSTRIVLDTIRLNAKDSADQQLISLEAPFAQFLATGHYNYQRIFTDIGSILTRQLEVPDSLAPAEADSLAKADSLGAGQTIDLAGTLTWPKSLSSVLPGFSLDHPAALWMHASTDSAHVAAAWSFPLFHYGDFRIDSLAGNLDADRDSLAGRLGVHRVVHPQFPLGQTGLAFQVSRGIYRSTLSLLDEKGKPKYRVGTRLVRGPGSRMEVSLTPGLLLNGEDWAVSPDNVIRLMDGRLESGKLGLSAAGQQLSLVTAPDSGAATEAKLSFAGFRLSSLTSLLANDTALAGGTLNGTASVRNWEQTPLLQADLKIDSLQLMRAALGDLTLKASNNDSGEYAIDLGLTGSGNHVTLSGNYRPSAPQPLDFRLQLQPLSLRPLEPLALGYVTGLRGRLVGDLQISGTMDRPKVLGALTFQNASFNPTIINSSLHLYHEKISFLDDGIHLDNFVLADSAKNEAVVNGVIRTRDYRNYFFNLNLQATDFEILGPKKSNDQMFYGPAYIDSKIAVTGTPSFPRVNMNLKLEDKSEVTFAVPESQPGIEEREGVVRFVNMAHPADSSLSATPAAGHVRASGFQFSGNLEVTPNAGIRIIIDQQNGDNLYVKGNATLNTTMDDGGNILLTGQYEIQQGKYEMSLNQLIKRSFDIQKGSTITWEGEPTHANVDITAMYQANAPAIDLVSDQLSNATPEMRTRYKQKEPIEVYLIIKGDMLKPDISFRLDMPEDHQNDLEGTVYNRLKQINLIPSELNKQVMGLLVLNSFIPDNPMDILSNGSGGLEQTARQSVSKILSQQLNNLASNLIKGVDLNFDLQSQQDYSSGTAQNATTLNVGVSKHLFNDRLTVSVGNDFALEGNSQEASGIAGNVSIEYALTKDGRYRLTAYRKDDNEEIIQGQVIETGVTFSLVMDYNKFKEIFAKVQKEQRLQLRKSRRSARKSKNRATK